MYPNFFKIIFFVTLVVNSSLYNVIEAQELNYEQAKVITKLSDPQIVESSGLAVGIENPSLFWTHNDSGDQPRLFAFDMSGKTQATLMLAGAKAVDWEDMATFNWKGQGVIVAGDVGDNSARRTNCTLYVIKEPKVDQNSPKSGRINVQQTIQYNYEDGPHNCESIAVDPTDQTIYWVSKISGKECKVFALAWPKTGGPNTVHVAKPIATLKISTTTAMDISPDGLRAVVLTYGDAFEYSRTTDQTWAAAFSKPGRRIKMPRRAQGESICYGADGKTLYLTSECLMKSAKNPSPLFEVGLVK